MTTPVRRTQVAAGGHRSRARPNQPNRGISAEAEEANLFILWPIAFRDGVETALQGMIDGAFRDGDAANWMDAPFLIGKNFAASVVHPQFRRFGGEICTAPKRSIRKGKGNPETSKASPGREVPMRSTLHEETETIPGSGKPAAQWAGRRQNSLISPVPELPLWIGNKATLDAEAGGRLTRPPSFSGEPAVTWPESIPMRPYVPRHLQRVESEYPWRASRIRDRPAPTRHLPGPAQFAHDPPGTLPSPMS